jgi:acyl carrier protein phosphodiesterase
VNFLAHAYLSFNYPEILAGNLISDFVKGKKKFDYSPGIQKGIQLHRMIDEYTDKHPVTGWAKQFFKTPYGLYAGAFIDIVYDHFLASDIHVFTDPHQLSTFAENTYRQVLMMEDQLPQRFRRVFYYMRTQDWLSHYRLREGIRNSFAGLVSRAAYLEDYTSAYIAFDKHYEDLKKAYEAFFPELLAFSREKISELNP